MLVYEARNQKFELLFNDPRVIEWYQIQYRSVIAKYFAIWLLFRLKKYVLRNNLLLVAASAPNGIFSGVCNVRRVITTLLCTLMLRILEPYVNNCLYKVFSCKHYLLIVIRM